MRKKRLAKSVSLMLCAAMTVTMGSVPRKFVISDFSRNGENNYKYYKLTYYLNVKDLESIETSSEGGTVQNKATFRGEAATVDTKVVGTPRNFKYF